MLSLLLATDSDLTAHSVVTSLFAGHAHGWSKFPVPNHHCHYLIPIQLEFMFHRLYNTLLSAGIVGAGEMEHGQDGGGTIIRVMS